MTQGRDEPRPGEDPDREPNSPAGAASPQGAAAGDRDQAEGEAEPTGEER